MSMLVTLLLADSIEKGWITVNGKHVLIPDSSEKPKGRSRKGSSPAKTIHPGGFQEGEKVQWTSKTGENKEGVVSSDTAYKPGAVRVEWKTTGGEKVPVDIEPDRLNRSLVQSKPPKSTEIVGEKAVDSASLDKAKEAVMGAVKRLEFAPKTTVTAYKLNSDPAIQEMGKEMRDKAINALIKDHKLLGTEHGHDEALSKPERDTLIESDYTAPGPITGSPYRVHYASVYRR